MPRRVDLLVGVRTERDLYDLPALRALEAAHPWLTVLPVVSEDGIYGGEQGTVVDAVTSRGPWGSRDVYVSGSRAMVRETVEALVEARVPERRIKVEEFAPSSWTPPGTEGERT